MKMKTGCGTMPPVLFCLWFFLLCIPASGQPPREPPPERTVVQQQLDALTSDESLTEEDRKPIAEAYSQTIRMLDRRSSAVLQAEALQQANKAAPETIADLRSQLEAKAPQPPQLEGKTLDELDQQLAAFKAQLETRQAEIKQLDTEIASQREQRLTLPKRLQANSERQRELQQKIAVPAADTALAKATRESQLAELSALEAEQKSLEFENAANDAYEILTLRRRLAINQRDFYEQQTKRLAEAVDAARIAEANRREAEAEQLLVRVVDVLKPFAEQNAALTGRRAKVTQRLSEVKEEAASVEQLVKRIQNDYQRLDERISRGGLNNATGMLLHKHRRELPRRSTIVQRSYSRQKDIAAAQAAIYALEENDLAENDHVAFANNVRDRVIEAGINSTPPEKAQREEQGDTLIARHEQYLRELTADSDRLYRTLLDLDTLDHELILEVNRFDKFITERVLWVPNRRPLATRGELAEVSQGASDLMTNYWKPALPKLWESIKQHPFWCIVSCLLVVLAFSAQRRLSRKLEDAGIMAMSDERYHFAPTMKALVITTLLAGIWPLVVWCFSWLLTSAGTNTPVLTDASAGLSSAALVLWAFEGLRRQCSETGLAIAHFEWSPTAITLIGRRLGLLIIVGVPLVALVCGLRNNPASIGNAAVARVLFLVGAIGLLAFTPWITNPLGKLLVEALGQQRHGWAARSYYLWMTLVAGTIGSLAILSAVGYAYTAERLAWRLFGAVCIAGSLLTVYAFVLRWLVLAQRRVAIAEARQIRVEAETAVANAPAELSDTMQQAVEEFDPESIDVRAIRSELRGLVRNVMFLLGAVLIWWTWHDVLPALKFIEEIPIFPGDTYTLTLGKLVVAGIAIAFTVMLTRTAPALLESSVLHRMPLDAGSRYAITTIFRYLVSVVGITIAANRIGFSWYNVQWFVAAITVGLGFGLQEIFANFISGLILLLERPIRVGDMVTIGETTGVVSRIRMRATTIRDLDRKELVVPNKEFITGRLLNWTLSDHLTRLVIEVGVAYASDSDLTRRTLLKVMRRHRNVLRDPAPLVMFHSFGDSSLNFIVHVYIDNLDHRWTVRDEIHADILRAFREANIEIPFPQRDINFRNSMPGESGQSGESTSE